MSTPTQRALNGTALSALATEDGVTEFGLRRQARAEYLVAAVAALVAGGPRSRGPRRDEELSDSEEAKAAALAARDEAEARG